MAMINPVEQEFADNLDPFRVEQARLARRRALAKSLIEQSAQPSGAAAGGFQGGKVYTVGSPLGQIAQSLAGAYMDSKTTDEAQALQQQRQAAQQDWQTRYNAATTPAEKQAALVEARNQGLRTDLEREFYTQEQKANEAEAARQLKAEETAAEKEAQRKFLEHQAELNRQNRLELRQTPTVVVHSGGGGRGAGGIKAPSGYRYNEDGTALEPIPGGPADKSGAGAKPMTAAQEKAALELGSEFATVNRLATTFKPEYAGDVRSTIEREFGKVAGGMAPKSTQEMTQWWSDQAMMDELPKRHELFGAALTPTETRSWNAATISPNMSPEKIQERLAIRQKIMVDAAARMRGSVVEGGRSGKQFEAATGIKPATSGSGSAKPQQPAGRLKFNPATGKVE